MYSHFSFDLLRNAESVWLSWIRKGMAGLWEEQQFLFHNVVLCWMCQPEEMRPVWPKKKNPNKQAWYLIQELLGKIEKTGCSRNNWSLTLICIHLRIPSVIIHTWPWLQQLETNSSAPNLMVTSQERSRSHTCWVSQSLAQVLSTPHSLHKACTPLEILGIMRGSEPKEHCVLLQPFPGWWK